MKQLRLLFDWCGLITLPVEILHFFSSGCGLTTHIHVITVLFPNFQVPFLSMDLNALANHLSKVKISRRLFIEEDLFPEDMVCSSLYLFCYICQVSKH